jgi:hypothetical protein
MRNNGFSLSPVGGSTETCAGPAEDSVRVATTVKGIGREIEALRKEISSKSNVEKAILQRPPDEQKRQEHNVTHIPFAPWCKFCIMGRGRNAAHRSTAEPLNQIQVDLIWLTVAVKSETSLIRPPGDADKPSNNQAQKMLKMPGVWALTAVYRPRGLLTGVILGETKDENSAVKCLTEFLLEVKGYADTDLVLTIRSDAEQLIKVWMKKVLAKVNKEVEVNTEIKERSEPQNESSFPTEPQVRMKLETAASGAHGAVGAVEKAHQTLQGLCRTWLSQLKEILPKLDLKVEGSWFGLLWRHMIWLHNHCTPESPYQQVTGKQWSEKVFPLFAAVLYKMTEGETELSNHQKLNARWKEARCVGHHGTSTLCWDGHIVRWIRTANVRWIPENELSEDVKVKLLKPPTGLPPFTRGGNNAKVENLKEADSIWKSLKGIPRSNEVTDEVSKQAKGNDEVSNESKDNDEVAKESKELDNNKGSEESIEPEETSSKETSPSSETDVESSSMETTNNNEESVADRVKRRRVQFTEEEEDYQIRYATAKNQNADRTDVWKNLQEGVKEVHAPELEVHTALDLIEADEEMIAEGRANELQSLKSFDVAVPIPREEVTKQVLQGRWIDRLKSPTKVKSRYVVRGYAQEYDEKELTFAPTISPWVIRALLAKAYAGLSTRQRSRLGSRKSQKVIGIADVSTAFLHADMDEDIYVYPPPEWRGEEGETSDTHVWKLKKSLYGLRCSPRQWGDHLRGVLEKLGFKQSTLEAALYIKEGTDIAIHVDDLLVIGTRSEVQQFFEDLKRHVLLKEEIIEKYKEYEFLGRTLCWTDEGIIWTTGPKYVERVLEHFSDLNIKEEDITGKCWEINHEDESELDKEKHTRYRSGIGKLLWMDRPDINYPVRRLAQKSNKPNLTDWRRLVKVLSYLRKYKHMVQIIKPIKLPKASFQPENYSLMGFADSDWAGQEGRKSTTGTAIYMFYEGCWFLVDWTCAKQESVALSSSEAEYYAMCYVAVMCWGCRNTLREAFTNPPTINKGVEVEMFSDSQVAISWSKRLGASKRSRHMEVRCFYLQNLVMIRRSVLIRKIDGSVNPADLQTKIRSLDTIMSKLWGFSF